MSAYFTTEKLPNCTIDEITELNHWLEKDIDDLDPWDAAYDLKVKTLADRLLARFGIQPESRK